MDPLRSIPVKLTLGILIGIVANHALGLSSVTTMIPLFFLLFFLAHRYQKRGNTVLFGLMAIGGSVFLGMFSYALAQPKNQPDHYARQQDRKPRTLHIKLVETLKPNAFSERFFAKITGVDGQKASGKVLLNVTVDSTYRKLHIDDELWAYATLEPLKAPLNPYQFSYKNYLSHLGVEEQLFVYPSDYIQSKNHSVTLYGIAAHIRTTIISKLEMANFGHEELSIIQALLLGQRQDITPETYNDYVNAGAVHILALSGLHIGILLLLLQWLLQPMERLPKGRKLKLVAIVLLLWCFALIAGFSASIIRAVTMFSFVAYAQYLNRPTNIFNILALSMFFILLVNPMLLFQVGFQMSYAAVFAIVWIYPKLQKLWNPRYWLLNKGWQLLSVSVAAQMGVVPISLFYFHQFPALFFVSNLAIIPFLGFILGLGILVIALALGDVLPHFVVVFYNGTIKLMNAVVHWVAQQGIFIFKDIPFDLVQLFCSYGFSIAAALLLTKITFKRMAFLLTAIISLQLWMLCTLYFVQRKEVLFIAHQNKNSVVMHHIGRQLNIFATHPNKTENMVRDYVIGERIGKIVHQPIQNRYRVGGKGLYIMDSLGIYPNTSEMDYILLIQSPKINLDRLLDSTAPKMIIADGSNYRNDIEKWKATCLKRKIPFHFTGEKGAYYFLGE